MDLAVERARLRFGLWSVDKRSAWLALPAAFLLGVGTFAIWPRTPVPTVAPEPMVLEKVQALGELHTARYTYRRVFETETSRPVAEWAQAIPGAASLVKSTTKNTALVSATINVEAGVDLGAAKKVGRWIVLPHARIYEPTIDGQVHQHKAGLLWRDDNIGLAAVAQAKRQAQEAAVKQGILNRAENEAVLRVRSLLETSNSPCLVKVDG